MIDDCRASHPSYLIDGDYAPRSEWLRFSGDRLQICDRNLRIILWRPYLLQWVKINCKDEGYEDNANDVFRENGLRCLYAARESLDLVRKSIDSGAHLRLAASFFLYVLEPLLLLCQFNLFFPNLWQVLSFPYHASICDLPPAGPCFTRLQQSSTRYQNHQAACVTDMAHQRRTSKQLYRPHQPAYSPV